MSYNLYGWNALVQNPWKAENVYKAIRQVMHNIESTACLHAIGIDMRSKMVSNSYCGK